MKQKTVITNAHVVSPGVDIENATVALGGPRFGDIFWTFAFEGGALAADVNGQSVALALQQDGFLRLTIAGDAPATLYLQPVLTEESEDE